MPEERGVARLVDMDKKAEFHLTFDHGFRELVVYTPSNQPDVLAVEPYTQTTDAINLQARRASTPASACSSTEKRTTCESRWKPLAELALRARQP